MTRNLFQAFSKSMTSTINVASAQKQTIRTKWIEKGSFDWNDSEQESYQAVKRVISTNAMAERTLSHNMILLLMQLTQLWVVPCFSSRA